VLLQRFAEQGGDPLPSAWKVFSFWLASCLLALRAACWAAASRAPASIASSRVRGTSRYANSGAFALIRWISRSHSSTFPLCVLS